MGSAPSREESSASSVSSVPKPEPQKPTTAPEEPASKVNQGAIQRSDSKTQKVASAPSQEPPKPTTVASAPGKEPQKPTMVASAPSKEPQKPTTAPEVPASKINQEAIQRLDSKTRKTYVTPEAKEEPPKPHNVVQASKEGAEIPAKFPHMYQVIVKHADSVHANGSSLLDRIKSSGIFLNNKKLKYWIEERTGNNCFMLFARGLQIVWAEDPRYWQWASLKDHRDGEIEIARLLNVCWLEINGRFETSYLTPKVMYEVAFVVMMEDGFGWEKPVNFQLKLPNREPTQRQESLLQAPRGQWMELKVGEFMAEEKASRDMEFSMFEIKGGQWKRGLIVKGAIIRPKK